MFKYLYIFFSKQNLYVRIIFPFIQKGKKKLLWYLCADKITAGPEKQFIFPFSSMQIVLKINLQI